MGVKSSDLNRCVISNQSEKGCKDRIHAVAFERGKCTRAKETSLKTLNRCIRAEMCICYIRNFWDILFELISFSRSGRVAIQYVLAMGENDF